MKTKSEVSQTAREALRAWILANLEKHRISATRLASSIGVATTTITKFLNDKSYQSTPRTQTIAALEDYFGEAAPSLTARVLPRAILPPGLGENEAEEYAPGAENGPTQALVKQITGKMNTCAPWRLHSNQLQGAGYLPGDILIVDLVAPPQDGDIVCAQIYDAASGTARTIFRLYQKPYLVQVPAGTPSEKPLLVDDETVAIRGVVIHSLRSRVAKSA